MYELSNLDLFLAGICVGSTVKGFVMYGVALYAYFRLGKKYRLVKKKGVAKASAGMK